MGRKGRPRPSKFFRFHAVLEGNLAKPFFGVPPPGESAHLDPPLYKTTFKLRLQKTHHSFKKIP